MVAPRTKEIVSSFHKRGGLGLHQVSSKPARRVKYVGYEVVLGLCDTLTESPIIQDRRSAALVLMVRCVKQEYWKFISRFVKERLKESVLIGYFTETDKSVRNVIAGIIVAVAKNDFADGQWNKLMNPIIIGINSDCRDIREITLYLLNKICDCLGKTLKLFHIDLLYAFQGAITDRSNSESSYIILKIILQICEDIGPQEMDYFKPLLSSILLSFKVLVANDEKKALECIDICAKLLEFREEIIGPHIETIFDICVKIFTLTKYHYKLRVKAMKIFTDLIKNKTKVASKLFEKKVMIQFVLHILFPLIDHCAIKHANMNSVLDEEKSLRIGAAEVIQAMIKMNTSVTLYVVRHVEPTLRSEEIINRKSAYFFIKFLTENSSYFVKNRERILKNIYDLSHPAV